MTAERDGAAEFPSEGMELTHHPDGHLIELSKARSR